MLRHERKSIRLKGYDYTEPNRYFVTICSDFHACIFGEVVNEKVSRSEVGQIVLDCWNAIPAHNRNVTVDICQVMPNHVHGILEIRWKKPRPPVGTLHATSLHSGQIHSTISPKPGSLSAIIRSLKSAVTKEVHSRFNSFHGAIWQSRFYDRIIRSDREYFFIERYIKLNPLLWGFDIDNPRIEHRSLETLCQTLRDQHQLDDMEVEYLLDHESLYREWVGIRDSKTPKAS